VGDTRYSHTTKGYTSIHFYEPLLPVSRDRHKLLLTVKRSTFSAAEAHPYTVELQDRTRLFIAQNRGVEKEP